jgi:hypothetical protein
VLPGIFITTDFTDGRDFKAMATRGSEGTYGSGLFLQEETEGAERLIGLGLIRDHRATLAA